MKLKYGLFAAALAISVLSSGSAWAVITGQYLLDGNATDSSGFNRNGTVEGGATFGAGLYQGSANSLVQTAVGQSVTLPPNTDFIRNVPGATLMAWVRPDNNINTTQSIVVANNANAADNGGIGSARAIIQIANSQFRALGRIGEEAGSVNVAAGAPVIGQTYFVAGVFDYLNGDLRLFVDGQQLIANENVAGWAANSSDMANLTARIGSNANGTTESWLGAIDGVRIYNNALTATDILNIYNAERFPPPLAGDTNGNGVVEPVDLDPIRANWRMTGRTRLQGNLSGDTAGLVDFVDFREWKTAILGGGGSLDGLDLSFAAVPEPSALLLTLMSAMAFGGCRSRRCAA